MSHFKVLVIGDDIESQLAPYDENKEVEPYIDPDWNHDDNLREARAFFARHPEGYPDIDRADSKAVLLGYHDGADLRFDEAGVSSEWSTRNPLSKWDYWTIGGRANASFRIKPGAAIEDYAPSKRHWSEGYGNEADHIGASDHALKRVIDYPAMIAARKAAAETDWAAYLAATDGLTPPPCRWDDFRARYDDINAARSAWWEIEWVQAVSRLGYMSPDEEFFIGDHDPRALFIARAESMAVTGYYAVVKGGEWISRGRMGWFGMSDDTTGESEWREKVQALIDAVPDDVWLTTVDCHI